MEKFEQILGYTFKNKALLKQALTHSSYTQNIHKNYERLEFLGDRILGFTIAEMLCTTYKNEPEGDLSQRFVHLVCKEAVSEVMKNLQANKFIIAENKDVQNKDTVLCDIGEAIIAAIYQDSGNINLAKEFILKNWQPLIKRNLKKDYKTTLQELAHQKALPAPVYTVLEKRGEDHNPEFFIEVSLGEKHHAKGLGHNKKMAEQQAAQNMLQQLDTTND